MLSLKGRQDKFQVVLPKEIIPEKVNNKYEKILIAQKSFIYKPIDLLNESIQKIEILGINDATVSQEQPSTGEPMLDNSRINQNKFPHSSTNVFYRAATNPLSLIDKTFNITFRHTLGFISYFILFESFLYTYSRDMKYKNIAKQIHINLTDEKGAIFSQIVLDHPLIDGIDMLSLDYSQPIAQSQTFNVNFKYSNFDYKFIEQNLDDNSLILE